MTPPDRPPAAEKSRRRSRATYDPGVNTYAAVLAGGAGTRFWPAGTRQIPKQMLPLTGGRPLLRETVDRLAGLVPPERVLVVCAERYAGDVAALLPELPAANVLAEPVARNTAAACAFAARFVSSRDPSGVLVTLPADHVISPDELLRSSLDAAATRAAGARTLLTLGLRPRFAATGYGWIELGPRVAGAGGHDVHRVASFVEKPPQERADELLEGGGHLWNLGMFAWRASDFLDELALHAPGVAEPFAGLDTNDPAAVRAAFDRAESISVDYAVMERSERIECVPCTFEWDDVGSLEAVSRHVPADDSGNHVVGDSVALDSSGCVVWSEAGGLVALLGVDDLIVVRANGATLVAPRSRAQEVKRLVAELEGTDLEGFR